MLENKVLLRGKNILNRYMPGLLIAANRIAARTVVFRNERRFLNGDNESSLDERSVLLFTSVRCASQYLSSSISSLYREMGGDYINLPNYFFHAYPKRSNELRECHSAVKLLKNRGFFFGALRTMSGDFPYENFANIVCVRDPRDVLVSGFYSLAYAHSPSDAKFARDSAEAREKGLEWFVRQPYRYEMVKEHYTFFREKLLSREGTLFFTYEELMTDFPTVLKMIADHIGHKNISSSEIYATLCETHQRNRSQASEVGGEEDNLRHRRSGASRQFEKKLKPETQAFLTEIFATELNAFGYERGLDGV